MFLAFEATASAEPNQYQGTFGKREVKTTLEWVADNKVTGELTTKDAPEKLVKISGANSAPGKMRVQLSQNGTTLGSAELTKSTTAASIIWSGKFKFLSGEITTLEFQRKRESNP